MQYKERSICMEQLMKKGLDGTQLKTVALVLMVLDYLELST